MKLLVLGGGVLEGGVEVPILLWSSKLFPKDFEKGPVL